MDSLITPFEEQNPDIKIDFQDIPNVNDAVRVQLGSGNGPDIFMADAFEIPEYVKSDLLLPLDKYVDQYKWGDIIYPWAMRSAEVDGKQYAIPNEYEASMLIYNQDLLDQLGLGVPTTREEFENACDTAEKNGIICIAYGSSGNSLLQEWLYEKYITNYGGVDAAKELFNGDITFQDPKIAGAFQLLVDDWQKGYWNEKQTASLTIDQARSLWYSGKALFNAEGSWMQGDIAAQTLDFKWGATSWPSMKDGVPSAAGIGVGAVLAVAKTTKVPDQVAKLINFMYTNPDLMAKGVAEGLQPRSTEFDMSLLSADVNANAKIMMDALQKVTSDPNNVGYVPWTFYPNETNTFLMDNLDAIFYGDMSVDDYLATAQSKLDAELAAGFKFAAD